MLTLIAALLLPPIPTMDTAPREEIAYEFAFAVEPGETPAEARARLREEAADYCRTMTREAGLPTEASACTKAVIAAVTAELTGDAGTTYAAR